MVLTDNDKRMILEKYNNEQISMRKIAQLMNINTNTVKLWINRFKLSGNINRKRGSGFKNIKINEILNDIHNDLD